MKSLLKNGLQVNSADRGEPMKILNFGSLNLDYVYAVDHMVQPGETLAASTMETYCGGKGLNQSIALARAGAEVYHAGLIGEEGEILRKAVADSGADTSCIETIAGKSGHTIIQVDQNGQNCILLYGGANRSVTREFVDRVISKFERGDILLLQNEINELSYIIDKAYERGLEIILNPSPYDQNLEGCDFGKISMFLLNEIEGEQITDVIIASVVPDIMHSLGSAIIKYFGVKPMVVSAGIKTGIRIVTENPRQVGADRIVDAVAAYTLFGGPVIVVDFGTATTYDIVGADGTFEAGVIAPGIRTSAQALWGEADMLPAIEIKKPASILAKETISAMQGGLIYGQIGQTEYIINQLKKESGYENAKVVATGGLGKIIAAETDTIDVYDPQLTLKGLHIIYQKNRKR